MNIYRSELVGKKLKDGRYEVIQSIGEGGFGCVYTVKDSQDKKVKALKIIFSNEAYLSVSQDNDRNKEIKYLKTISCNYIIQYFDSFRHEFLTCIITEYCSGGTLDQYIKDFEDSQIPDCNIFKWSIQILRGLAFLHLHNIIHRDLKPGNIFKISRDVKIGDLGLARTTETINTSSKFAGTLSYMSPEVVKSEKITTKCDVWSFGCVLYELLNLRKAFEASDQLQLLQLIINDDINSLASSSSDSFYSTILRSCFEKDPSERASAQELLEKYEADKKDHVLDDRISIFKENSSKEKFYQKKKFILCLVVSILILISVTTISATLASSAFSRKQEIKFRTIRVRDTIIYSPSFTNWGKWGPIEYCPNDTYVIGFKTKFDTMTLNTDNTALGGVSLLCSDGDSYIRSLEGHLGDWSSETIKCKEDKRVVGFDINIQTAQGDGNDDTAANSIRLQCENGQTIQDIVGAELGNWSGNILCPSFNYVCGIQTQVEEPQDDGDDTTLNNVRMICCN